MKRSWDVWQKVKFLTMSASQNLSLQGLMERKWWESSLSLSLNLNKQLKIFVELVPWTQRLFGNLVEHSWLVDPFPHYLSSSLSIVLFVIRRKFHRVRCRHRPYRPVVWTCLGVWWVCRSHQTGVYLDKLCWGLLRTWGKSYAKGYLGSRSHTIGGHESSVWQLLGYSPPQEGTHERISWSRNGLDGH